jgi:hypothetical protein
MNKPVFGLVLGGLLGVLDGLTAWFTPAVRPQIVGIVIGSTFKGLIAGVLIGWFAKKVGSLALGTVFGVAVGFVLAYAVAAMPSATGEHYYFQIMLPGAIVPTTDFFPSATYAYASRQGGLHGSTRRSRSGRLSRLRRRSPSPDRR